MSNYDQDTSASGAGTDQRSAFQGATLLVNDSKQGWMEPATRSWDREFSLRDLLVDHPSLLPGVVDPNAAAVRELRIAGVGSVDVVALETNGSITVCEAKLSTNPEIRRAIVGQALAYASGLAAMSIDEFESAWCARSGGASVVEELVGSDAAPEDASSVRDAIGRTLESGSFRVVLAVDRITDELRSIVTYLAEHMDTEVSALQLAYARSDSVEIIVPQTWGIELASERSRRSGTARSRGFRSSVADALPELIREAEGRSPGFGQAIRTILNEIEPNIAYLYSGEEAMLDPVVVPHGPWQPAKIITSQKTIGIRVCFHWCTRISLDVKEAALALLEQHPAIAPLVVDVRAAEFRKGPLIPFSGGLDQPGAPAVVANALAVLCRAAAT